MHLPSSRSRAFCYGLVAFLLHQYALGIIRLAFRSGGMDNKFSALAREKHLAFLLGENFYVLLAYALLGAAAWLFLFPCWQWIESRFRPHPLWSALRGLLFFEIIHQFFLLRLSTTRPYFQSDVTAITGHEWIQILPEMGQFALFQIFPLTTAAFALIWQAKRWIHTPRRRWSLLIAGCIPVTFSAYSFFSKSVSDDVKSPSQAYNILVLGSDSLRGDRLGLTGYQPQRRDGLAAAGVSPTIDALAARSQVFTHCFTPIGSTLESNTSLHSSLYPHQHGLRHMYPAQSQIEQTTSTIKPLAAQLKEVGYHTTAIGDWCAGFFEIMPLGHENISVSSFDNFRIYMSQAVIMAHFIVPLYFDHPLGHHLFPEIPSFAQFVTPDVVTDRLENHLAERAQKNQPFFTFAFYSCNHLPYRSQAPYHEMFADPHYRGKHKNSVDFDIDAFIGGTDLQDKWKQLSPSDAAQISALYDGCTRQFDDCVKRVLAALKKHGLDQRTIVIIHSDHGDDLYEPGATLGHGLSFHGGDQTNHVPLVMHIPGKKPQVFPHIVRSIDLAPTLAELCGARVPNSWQGQSFRSWIDSPEEAKSRPFYAETGFPFIQFRVSGIQRPSLPPMDQMTFIDDQHDYHFVLRPEYEKPLVAAKERMLRTERWKLILTPTADGKRHYRLFDIVHDKHHERNVATQFPEVLAAMKLALNRWVDEGVESNIEEIFPQGEPAASGS